MLGLDLTRENNQIAPVEPGAQIIAGKIYGSRMQYGHYTSTYKFGIRQVNGQTYWGTIPGKLLKPLDLTVRGWEKKLNGTNVVIEATVSPAREDHTHGFYKRPKLVSADLLNS